MINNDKIFNAVIIYMIQQRKRVFYKWYFSVLTFLQRLRKRIPLNESRELIYLKVILLKTIKIK
jgi:hypothetical protein